MMSEVKKYLELVEESCPASVRRCLIPKLQSELSAYAEKHPQVTVDELINRFGEPEQTVRAYLADRENDGRDRQKDNRRKTAVVVSLAVLGAAVILAAVWIIRECSRHTIGDTETSVTEIL